MQSRIRNKVRCSVPRTRRALHSLVRLHPAPWRWRVGVEAGLALGLPPGLFTASGHQALGIGASTALYGASLHRLNRLRLVPLVAVDLVLAAALGVADAANAWLTSAALVFVSALASTLTLGWGRPAH